MQTSDAGRKFIESFEGLFLHTYDDGTGVLTIGYGHTSAAGLPHVAPRMTITKDQADAILSADLGAVETDVNRLVKEPINQNQFDALVSFHFNTGALARASVLRAVNAGSFEEVRGDLLLWCHAGGRFLKGLERRREAEADMFDKPIG